MLNQPSLNTIQYISTQQENIDEKEKSSDFEFNSLKESIQKDCKLLIYTALEFKVSNFIENKPILFGASAAQVAQNLLSNSSKELNTNSIDPNELRRKGCPVVAVYGNLIFRKEGNFPSEVEPENFVKEIIEGYSKTNVGSFLLDRTTQARPIEIYLKDNAAEAEAQNQWATELRDAYSRNPFAAETKWKHECLENCKDIFYKNYFEFKYGKIPPTHLTEIFFDKQYYEKKFGPLPDDEMEKLNEIFSNTLTNIMNATKTGDQLAQNYLKGIFKDEGKEVFSCFNDLKTEILNLRQKYEICKLEKDLIEVNNAKPFTKNGGMIAGEINIQVSTGLKILTRDGTPVLLPPGIILLHELVHALTPNKDGDPEKNFQLIRDYLTFAKKSGIIIDSNRNKLDDQKEFDAVIKEKYDPKSIPLFDLSNTNDGPATESTATFFEQIFTQQISVLESKQSAASFAMRKFYLDIISSDYEQCKIFEFLPEK